MPAAHASPRPVSRFALPIILLGAIGAGFGGTALAAPGGGSGLERVRVTAADDVRAAPVFDASPLFAAATAGTKPKAVAPVPARPAPRQPAKASRSRTEALWAAPLLGRLTSRFGWRWGRAHGGVDVAVPIGTAVRAVGAGTVVSAGWGGGYGRLVTIRHADGTVTAYAHMSGILVAAGERVSSGALVGRSGNSGRSTGPHLHFEVRRAGRQVNPLTWLAERGVRL